MANKRLRVVITGGGTGGHVYPALAVAQALQESPDVESLLYIGNTGKLESRLVPEAGFSFEGLSFSGMPRGINLAIFGWAGQLVQSIARARSILSAYKPDVIFGTGGYVTGPVMMAARTLGIPYVIHEPDAHPGLVNRTLAPYARLVTAAFEEARTQLKNPNIVITGNPLRGDIGSKSRPQALAALSLLDFSNQSILLVTGGSQGAKTLNEAVLNALPTLIDKLNLVVLHQTGDSQFEAVKDACPEAYLTHPRYRRMAFITDMASTLAVSNIALCRAGSMTLSEMYRAGIPTLLIPYPYAAADHQRKNAEASEKAGASVLIADADLNGESLAENISRLINTPGRLLQMKAAAVRLSHPDATEQVAQRVRQIGQREETTSIP